MYLLQLSHDLVFGANEISLFLGITISGLFYFQYKKYNDQLQREEMLDHFLEENHL
jgi:hypothetical protein